MKSQRWAVLVVWENGEEEYLKQGLGSAVATFTKQAARDQVEFMKIGMEGDCQSINVVPAPPTKEPRP